MLKCQLGLARPRRTDSQRSFTLFQCRCRGRDPVRSRILIQAPGRQNRIREHTRVHFRLRRRLRKPGAGLCQLPAQRRAPQPFKVEQEISTAKRMGSTTLTLATSHVAMLAEPQKVADFMIEAAESFSRVTAEAAA